MSSWATKRQHILIALGVAVLLAILALVAVPFIYKTPSCADGKQNQDEVGVDCGGGCQYLCSVQVREPSIRFVRSFTPLPGRTDVIAYIDNPNTEEAVRGARYTLELYGEDRTLVGKHEGAVDLAPGTTIPVYLPAVVQGGHAVSQAFLSFDDASLKWFKVTKSDELLRTEDISVENSASPRIYATLVNPSVFAEYDVTVVATVFDATNTAIAASQTVVPHMGADTEMPLIFTWGVPFSAEPVRVDILVVPEVPPAS